MHKGQKISEEQRKRMSEAQKKIPRKPHTEEWKKKISEIQKTKGAFHKGHKHSEETRKKMSEKRKLRVIKDSTREKISKAMTGENHHQYGKHPSEETLKKLSESHKGIPHSEESKRKLSERMTGEKHPAWKGGISYEPYCPKFNNSLKERVRAFFGYICIECGEPQNGIGLDVHHVNFNKKSCCDSSKPIFVPLCHSCHSKTQKNREFWEQHFTSMVKNYFEGKCYLSKEEYQQLLVSGV